MKSRFLLAALALIFTIGCNHNTEEVYTDANGDVVIVESSGCANGHCHHTTTTHTHPAATTQVPATIHPAPTPTHQDTPPVTITVTDPGPAPVVTLPAKGVTRAVIVGINKFLNPGAPPLTGCVPDAARLYAKSTGGGAERFGAEADARLIAKCAANSWGVDPKNVVLLLNEQATVAAVKKALNDAVAVSQSNDDIIYWQSSHGTEDTIADDNGKDVHGIVCCFDFGWDREHEFCDVDFRAIFSKAKPGVGIWWGADSCNSGTLDRNLGKHKHPVRAKSVTQPAHIRIRVHSARVNGGVTRSIAEALPVAFLPGCKADQTSADSEDDDGFPGGAETIMFIKEVDGAATVSVKELAKRMDTDLAADGYDQVVVPSGSLAGKPWLKN